MQYILLAGRYTHPLLQRQQQQQRGMGQNELYTFLSEGFGIGFSF